jgi:hypothetical protein
MKRYYIHIPSWIHVAVTAYGANRKDAIARFKHQYGLRRMPSGYGIWEA